MLIRPLWILFLFAMSLTLTALAQPGVQPSPPPVLPPVAQPDLPIAIAYFNGSHHRGTTLWVAREPEDLEARLRLRIFHPQYMRILIHLPQGFEGTMAGGAWHALPEGHADVYRRVFGEVLAQRAGYEITLYTGSQFYTAYTIHGRPRPQGEQYGFDGEPDWIDPRDPHDVRGIRELTIQPWADIGVESVVFDHGSSHPMNIVVWKRILRRQVKKVGLEAIPWVGDNTNGHIDWEACERGVEYHANQRFRAGHPFDEVVPDNCAGRAFVWLVHDLDPTAEEVADMMRRGWTPVVLHLNDQLYSEAVNLYGGGTPPIDPGNGGD